MASSSSWSSGHWLQLLIICGVVFLKAEASFVNITYLQAAVAKGAVCLDGSPPAYHLDKGFGAGVNKWVLEFEGGGWCHNLTTCLGRKNTRLGSSKLMSTQYDFSGILSNKEEYNPDFYNWNRVKVRYCDGSSYTGDVESVNPETNLHFRGGRIFDAVIEELLAKGVKDAQNVLFSGSSAGGLATILHCEKLRSMLPATTNFKCLSDAGFFIHAKDVSGAPYIENFYREVVSLHGSAKNLPVSCTSRLQSDLCYFPQYIIPDIKTPLFLVNAAYDTWQIANILAPGVADPSNEWYHCKLDLTKCSASQLNILHDFRQQLLNALSVVGNTTSRGYFVDSCYSHLQIEARETWFSEDSPKLDNTTIAKAVGDWYYERSQVRKIDCQYPCNPTCHNSVFDSIAAET